MTGQEWLHRFAVAAKRLSMEFEIGTPELERMLDLQQAEAAVFVGVDLYTVILRANPTASAVLEEFAHCLQARRGSFSTAPAEEVIHLREIQAKECLITNGDKFAIPEHEADVTRGLLDRERAALERTRRYR